MSVLVLVFSVLMSDLGGQQRTENPRPADAPSLGQSSTLLPDGRWLLVGGEGPGGPDASIAIVDTRANRSTPINARLLHPRSGHTATVLPDGSVLVVGGRDSSGLVGAIERIDLATGEVTTLPGMHLTPRAAHTATLLTDGSLAIIGGTAAGRIAVGDAEILSTQTGDVRSAFTAMSVPRHGHEARLLSDGRVAVSRGIGTTGDVVSRVEVFDPQLLAFVDAPDAAGYGDARPALSGSSPEDGAVDVVDVSVIGLRFGAPIAAGSLSSARIDLKDGEGVLTKLRLVTAESGRLLFAHPLIPLKPGSTYTLSLGGVRSPDGLQFSDASVTFSVAARQPDRDSSSGNEEDHGGINSPWRKLSALQAGPGVTALAGQVLKLNGAPLAGVTLKIEEHETRTDHTGRFLLEPLDAGHHELVIDGRTASGSDTHYAVFEVGVDVRTGETNVLPYTSWMPKIDKANEVIIPSPTTAATVVRTARIPGLELHLPAGAVIRDIDGNAAQHISITPIPVDQPPFPLPTNVYVPVYFTIQPGGGYVYVRGGGGRYQSPGARLYYPNYKNEAAGAPFDFWRYDPEELGWYVYGQGTVAPDGQHIVPEPGVQIYEFTGAMVGNPGFAPPEGSNPCNPCGGDPVDLGTGLFLSAVTDLSVPDVIPLTLTRMYRTRDSRSRAFGIGASSSYDMFLVGDITTYSYADLVLGNGTRFRFVRTSPGTGFQNAIYEHTTSQSPFYAARIVVNPSGAPDALWSLRLRDGSRFEFRDGETATYPGQAAVTKMVDRFGNAIVLTRDANGNLTRIRGASNLIDLTYDASRRVTQAKDNSGRTVTYDYASGRLWKVTDVRGGVTEYTYDVAGRLRTIKDARGIAYLTNTYDGNSRVAQQTLADGAVYTFTYTLNGNGKVTETRVTDPRGFVRRVTFNSAGYWMTDTRALGQTEQQTLTLERDPTSNFVLSRTDARGRQVAYTYSDKGRVQSVTHLAGTAGAVTTSLTFESNYASVETMTDPLGHTTRYEYGWNGSLAGLVDATERRATFTPNTYGQTVSVATAAGSLQFSYSRGSLAGVTTNTGAHTQHALDGAGNVLSTTDPLGNRTGREYNAFGQPVRITDASGGVTRIEYDPNGNVTSVADPREGTTAYTYDVMDRLATRTDPLLGVERFFYDGSGNVLQYIDRAGRITNYRYDALDRVVEVTYADTSTTSYVHDNGNRLTDVVDSVGGLIELEWNDLDQLVSETTSRGVVGYGYDAAGRRTTQTVQGQSPIVYTYDDADRLTAMTQGPSVTSFEYDDAGRRSVLTLPNALTVSYGYDAAGNVSDLTYRMNGTVIGAIMYTFDAMGRRLSMEGTEARVALPPAIASTTYNAANQLTQWGTSTLTYDVNGNVMTMGARTFGWDARNQLASIGGAASATFSYDAFGRRVLKDVNGSSTGFLYDGEMIVQEQSGSVPFANMVNGPALDEVLQRTDAQGTRFILADALGSANALVDSGGAFRTRYTYEPFGATAASGEGSGHAAQFTGRESDGTGLYYYRARYYSPGTGRFLSEDPVQFIAGGGVNAYLYVDNDPINFVDPTGELVWWAAPIIGGLIGGGVDLAWQMFQNGGKIECADWGDVGWSAGLGAGLSLLGPSGPIFGRAGAKAAQLGYKGGFLNTGNTRFGWSWHKGQNWFGAHGGKPFTPGHWHQTPIPGPAGHGVVEFGVGGGAVGGAAGAAFGGGGKCSC